MSLSHAATKLGDLPDELLLHIIHQLSCIRSLQPQSTAFKKKAREKSRQCENRMRQLALCALGLSNRRLHRIATPTLYSSFVGCATSQGLKPLNLFHRTIITPRNSASSIVPLAHHLKYVENRLSDHIGNSLYDDAEKDDAVTMASQYFSFLASIVNQAPNIQHLSVVSLEAVGVSFWETVLATRHNHGEPLFAAEHGFAKLQSLCFQVHTRGYGGHRNQSLFGRICSAATTMPLLQDLRASGVIANASPLSLPGRLEKLTRLEITECMLDMDEVISLWDACDGLRRIVCEWAFLHNDALSSSDLYEGLLRHRETLKSLHLDMREVRVFDLSDAHSWKLGSLQPFEALTELIMCEQSLLGVDYMYNDSKDQAGDARLSDLLPKRLERFVLLLHGEDEEEVIRIPDVRILQTLCEDCPRHLPKLKEIVIKCQSRLSVPAFLEDFEGNGVDFRLEPEATHWSPLAMPREL